MDLPNAQETFVQLLGQLHPDSKIKFLEWVCAEYNPNAAPEPENAIMEEQEPDDVDKIALDLRSSIPPNCLAPYEPQLFPTQGPNSDLTQSTTLHIDAFLYPTEDDVDSLCSQLQVSRNYCLSCGSWKTSPLNFISHSISREQLRFIFNDLLPDLTGKTLLDIGSRLGPVLYGGYFYSRASRLIGVELNSFFCDLQLQVVTKYNLADRITVVCSDICEQAALLQEADVIVMNNVFEFFIPLDKQARVWEFLFKVISKRGTVLVTIPSIQESCQHLPLQAPLLLDQWVTELPTGASPTDEELNGIHLYSVL